MNSSRLHSRSSETLASSANRDKKVSAHSQSSIDFDHDLYPSGSCDDASLIRGALIQSIKRCGKSRAAIAEEMEFLLARTVTEKMLNAFTAESRDDRRWPAEFDRAFCIATGDYSLLECRVQLAGLHLITEDERDLMELGRQFLLREQASEQINLLQRRLHGRTQ